MTMEETVKQRIWAELVYSTMPIAASMHRVELFFDENGDRAVPGTQFGWKVSLARKQDGQSYEWSLVTVPIIDGAIRYDEQAKQDVTFPFEVSDPIPTEGDGVVSQSEYRTMSEEICPVCRADDDQIDRHGSDDIDVGATHLGLSFIHDQRYCRKCGAHWYREFQLIGFSDLERPEHMNFPGMEGCP